MPKKMAAELIGTAILTFMGCGAVVFLGASSPGGYLAVAFAFGLSAVACAYVFGGVSGCHVNPAVSLAMWLDKRLSGADLAKYVIAQALGAVAGAGFLKLISSAYAVDQTGALGANAFGAGGLIGALAVEIVLTFVFVFTVLGVTADETKKSVSGIVTGLTLTLVHIVGIPLTGTSVNPARSFGPALFAGGAALGEAWLFVVAPLIGATLAAFAFGAILPKS
ncbi:MAG: aquaporin [Clostridiales bacterium]|nr:aquaporin [Clostridiales bacterium]